jgi:nucleoside-diphosphate-sugar epimerase
MGKIKKILVTGGTGFVGTWIFKTRPEDVELSLLSHEMYCTMKWDYLNWDYIIHLAPISPDRVIDYCQHKHIKFLHASSGAVYEGKGKYADDKRAWEDRCEASGVDHVICRLFATSGLPFQNNKALSIFIQNALKKESLQVWGDGSTVRSYLYGEDVGKSFWKILFEGVSGEAYDVGSLFPYSMLQIAKMVQSVVGGKIEMIPHEETLTPTYYVPKNMLIYKEKTSLIEAIERMTQK